MAKAELLRVRDVRDAYRLIGECRDVGSEPALWQKRMFEGLSRLFGGVVASGGEGKLTGTERAIAPLTYAESGFDARDFGPYVSYMREGGPGVDPFILALQRTSRGAITRTRTQVVGDRVYCRSIAYDRYLRPGNVHHRLASIAPTATRDAVSLLHLHRLPGDRDFSARERALLEFFHDEISPLIGRALVSAAEPTPAGLSRRLRQTLACLVEGDSEKQVAVRLGVSHATAHQYVTTLYRRFGVKSRGQLLAYVMKRLGSRTWGDGLTG